MDVVFAGRLSRELLIKDVVEHILECGVFGPCILRIDTAEPSRSGKILIADSRYIVAACLIEGASHGYDVVRLLLSMSDGLYTYLRVLPHEQIEMVPDLFVALQRVLDIIPNFPEDPRELFDEKSLLDKVFSETLARMPLVPSKADGDLDKQSNSVPAFARNTGGTPAPDISAFSSMLAMPLSTHDPALDTVVDEGDQLAGTLSAVRDGEAASAKPAANTERRYTAEMLDGIGRPKAAGAPAAANTEKTYMAETLGEIGSPEAAGAPTAATERTYTAEMLDGIGRPKAAGAPAAANTEKTYTAETLGEIGSPEAAGAPTAATERTFTAEMLDGIGRPKAAGAPAAANADRIYAPEMLDAIGSPKAGAARELSAEASEEQVTDPVDSSTEEEKFYAIDAEFIRGQAALKAKPPPKMPSAPPSFSRWQSPGFRLACVLLLFTLACLTITFWKEIHGTLAHVSKPGAPARGDSHTPQAEGMAPAKVSEPSRTRKAVRHPRTAVARSKLPATVGGVEAMPANMKMPEKANTPANTAKTNQATEAAGSANAAHRHAYSSLGF